MLGDLLAQLLDALAGAGRDHGGVLHQAADPGDGLGFGDVGLVQHHDLRDVEALELPQHGTDRTDLPLGVGVGGVHHVQQQVRVPHLLQGGAEGLHQLGRQVAHEADGVGVGELAAVRGLGAAHRGVEGGEKGVLHQHPGSGEPVEQGGLAGVGVAGDRDRRHLVAVPVGALRLAARGHRLDLAAQLGHAVADAPPVQLDLGLTGAARAHPGAAGGDAATGLAGHGVAPAAQTGQQVLELGQLHLGLALAGLGVLGEDVQDQGCAVDDLDLDHVLQGAALTGAELPVDHDGVGAHVGDDLRKFGRLALAEECGGVGVCTALQHSVQHLGAGGLGECCELAQAVLGVLEIAGGVEPCQHHALQAQLAVLDLGDVLELRGQPAHAAQGLAVGEVHLLAVGGGLVGDGRDGRVPPGEDPLGQRVASASGLLLLGSCLRGRGAVRGIGFLGGAPGDVIVARGVRVEGDGHGRGSPRRRVVG